MYLEEIKISLQGKTVARNVRWLVSNQLFSISIWILWNPHNNFQMHLSSSIEISVIENLKENRKENIKDLEKKEAMQREKIGRNLSFSFLIFFHNQDPLFSFCRTASM